ncbi:hypothetical protein VSP9026_02271 [Vibrio spartinae]|uniref:Uncharacterized protein n=1 Tax=Vibrio spartinae TaxID=1918945 RepID=A0A1N6M5B4_9VIBR|nr:hypothetical protein VSP9026_02271 [Vibrio spartinae]
MRRMSELNSYLFSIILSSNKFLISLLPTSSYNERKVKRYDMTNSLRQTSILIISTLAMLMSSYVSSMPMMDMSPISTYLVQPSNHDSMEMSEATASHHAMIGCPSMEVTKSDSSIHCDSSSTSGGDCCKSVRLFIILCHAHFYKSRYGVSLPSKWMLS